jgi:Flp pilus assembly protein TadD
MVPARAGPMALTGVSSRGVAGTPSVVKEMETPFRLRLELSDENPGSAGTPAARTRGAADAAAREVLATFRTAAKLQVNDPDYHYILGDALAQLGRHAEAVPVLREAIQMNRDEAAYHTALAKSLWALGEHEAAVTSFREVTRLQPDDVSALNALGVALTAASHYREAVRTFHSALQLDRGQGPVYNNLGVALFRSGRQGEASRAFRRAIQLGAPDDAEAHRNLGLALLASGRPQQALPSFREAIRRHPEDPQGHLDLGDLLNSQGRSVEALAAYDEAFRLDPGCLRDRPESHESREAIRLQQLREEVRSEAQPSHPGVQLWKGLLAAGHALRAVVPSPKGTVWVLLALVLLGRVTWVTSIPYVDYWLFKDKVAEIAGAPVREDAEVLQLILQAANERGLEDHVKADSCSVETKGKWRIIRCEYSHPVQLLPGVAPTLRFRFKVERPFFAGETIFL